MTSFDHEMALTPVGEPATEGGHTAYDGVFGDGWLVGPAVNGGAVMALGLRGLSAAMEQAGGPGEAIAFSAVFPAASTPGPVRVEPEILRVGRRISTGAVSVLQRDGDAMVERMRMIATHADLGEHSEPLHRQVSVPDMPPPEHCIPATRDASDFARAIAILDRLDLRLDPATAGFGLGQPSGVGELRGWIRFIDGREPDIASLPFFLDAFPPVTVDLGAYSWAPTLEFSGHLRARPAPGWLRMRVTTTNVAGGLFEEDCVIWDSTDRVVAQSRQLAGVRMPSGPVT